MAALPTLFEALWTSRRVRFEYESALHEAGERVVDPLGLVVKGSVWYLVGDRNGDTRTYRVSRIGAVTIESHAAVRPADFDLVRYWNESSRRFRERLPEVNATYLVDPGALRWIRYKGWRILEQIDEGERIRVRLRFDSDEEVVQLALAHGDAIELVEPAVLRDLVREAAERTVRLYSRETRRTARGRRV